MRGWGRGWGLGSSAAVTWVHSLGTGGRGQVGLDMQGVGNSQGAWPHCAQRQG
jgi:hypothetical protein